MLLNYQKLEYLGLAKNGIADLCLLKPILSNIGKQVLSQEELEKYRAKEKERDDLLADAKKKKKKLNDDEIPQLYPLVEIQAGRINSSLSHYPPFNLAAVPRAVAASPPAFIGTLIQR